MEVCIHMPDGEYITIFVAHLIANFGDVNAGNTIRKKEVQELIRIMQPNRGTPHLLMGDFSAIAPHERMKASNLERYIANLQHEYKQHPESFLEYPSLDYVIPCIPYRYSQLLGPVLKVVKSLLLIIPPLYDLLVTLIRAPRGNLHLLYKEGYVDCFHQKNPHLDGLTAPTIALSGRFDYIFASTEMGQRLASCDVFDRADDIDGVSASDHLPVFAEFQ